MTLSTSAGTGNNSSIFFERVRLWQIGEDHIEVRTGFDTIRLGRFNEAIKTGPGPGDAVAEQEVLSADDELPDGILSEVNVIVAYPS